jgi:inorganic phosphate transporter, PiT family
MLFFLALLLTEGYTRAITPAATGRGRNPIPQTLTDPPRSDNRLQNELRCSLDHQLFNICVGLTFCFAFVNGFHDGGNVVATIIASRSMRPMRALLLASLAEFAGPLLLGTAVAQTMAGSILEPTALEIASARQVYLVVICAVTGAIIWKIPSWFLGLPSSASHALLGGMVGAGMVSMGTSCVVVHKVIKDVAMPLLLAPMAGILFGFLVFSIIRSLCSRANRGIGHLFTALQKPTMIMLAAGHGSNDAQKSMGMVAIALAAGSGEMHGIMDLPTWVIWGCAAALAVGLTAGGWRLVRTVGFGISRLEPVHSFSSQFTAVSVILATSLLGGPVSTSQIVASSVMGVGASRRLSGVRWSAASNIVLAWLLTVPVCALLSAGLYWLLRSILAL